MIRRPVGLPRRRRRSSVASPARPFTLVTSDAVRLNAVYLPRPTGGPGPVTVVLHGLTHSMTYHTTRAVIERAARHSAVLAFDLRGHGRSGGRSTVGRDEHLDLDAAVAWAREQGHDPVSVLGFSLGGSVAIRQADLGTHPPDGLVAVSAPSQWYIRESIPMRRVHWMLEHPLGPFIGRRLGVRLGDTWEQVPRSPLESVGNLDIPVLLVHGLSDHYFGPSHAMALHRSAPHSELWLEPGMSHAETGTGPDLVDRMMAWIGDHVPARGELPAAGAGRPSDTNGN